MSSSEFDVTSYYILEPNLLPAYLSTIPNINNYIDDCDNLSITEIGDGNLNYVYKVTSQTDPTKSIIVKQAVPYLRMAGEAWPLGRERMRYEIRALAVHNNIVPQFVPAVLHADEGMSTVVLQCLNKHIILREGMIEGIEYPNVGNHIGQFLAETLFKTSAWSMESAERRELSSRFTQNTELCKLTEDFIFKFPFQVHESNYSNPDTDRWVMENIHTDDEYKASVLYFKQLFVTKAEALLHGDLHSGSVMVNQNETYVIDPEFSFFGPISFDIGKVFSNFILCCTAHFERKGGKPYQDWILAQIPIIWNTFESCFVELWINRKGEATLAEETLLSEDGLKQLRARFLKEALQDAVGFAACSMARRTIGIAGVADIREIENVAMRSKLEIANLKLSKHLMLKRSEISDINDLSQVLNDFYSEISL